MNKILSIIFFPLFYLMVLAGKNQDKFKLDVEAWCKWKSVSPSPFMACSIFMADKAFRNLTYYRLGRSRIILSWIFKGYDHLQITTPNVDLKGGLILQHGFSTIISAESIGSNCKIYQQVTIGYNHHLQAPKIGDNVEICCGAKIIGGVKIGNNVLIGANAVVVKDIPDNSIVAGVPAKVIGSLNPKGDIFSRC